jgi:hypothetical protein
VRSFALLLTLLLALVAAPARAQDSDDDGDKDRRTARQTLTLETSLGPIDEYNRRPLRARGHAPRGSKLTIRFYRGKKRIAKRKVTVRKRSYKADKPIDRTGSYKVVVVARTRTGSKIRVSATLKYGPQADAPSAPEPDDDGGGDA